ncbi:WbqC family protein [Anaeroselena agilis]|uniref:WbqC family protein n=1 Tax=Anaeroselena agilis TaxID=3063788 RepID=A0ABU3NTK6_9FIRM|nr:WbqC family protein [Selenomonadales bacterium 4137-cl]
MRKIAISQSNYIPWKGYFDLISRVDEFILFDSVQYTRRDWRNRNQVLSPQGLLWLTVPVETKGNYHRKICEVRVCDAGWAEKHWSTLRHCYARAPYFSEVAGPVREAYERCGDVSSLSRVNYIFLKTICDLLAITTKLSWSTDYDLIDGKSERLLHLCEQAGADAYLSGPAARAYLDEALFQEKGIAVEWMSYDGYPDYPQINSSACVHTVSVLDLLFNVGISGARAHVGRNTARKGC